MQGSFEKSLASEVLKFWFGEGAEYGKAHQRWFDKDPTFDAEVGRHFSHVYEGQMESRDWHEDSDAEAVARGVLEGIRARDDSIVLMHSWPDSTAEALPRILDGIAAEGAELVNIETLMG